MYIRNAKMQVKNKKRYVIPKMPKENIKKSTNQKH